MIQEEPIQNFDGFGLGKAQGEYFYSQGMSRGMLGVIPGWVCNEEANSGSLPGLALINFFTRGKVDSNDKTFAIDAAVIWQTLTGNNSWSSLRTPAFTDSSPCRGMIVDQTNRLLYFGNRYFGKSADLSTFTDNWKDFGATHSITDPRPADLYEDWVVIGNGNAVALLNVTDDSFDNEGLLLPTGYKVSAIRSGRNGILVGVNTQTRGAVLLWDAFSDGSIAPWIWFPSKVKSIVPANSGGGNAGYNGAWYVFTERGIYLTNGYTIQPIYEVLPDSYLTSGSLFSNMLPQGADIVGNRLIVSTGAGSNRQKAGVWILNLDTSLWEFAPHSNGCLTGVTTGAVFFDGSNTIHLSYSSAIPATNYISSLVNTTPPMAFLITEAKGVGGNVKVAEAAKFTVTPDSRINRNTLTAFTLSLKVYNFHRSLWNTATTSGASTSPGVLKITGGSTSGNAVGDEVTIMQGVNAGLVRHITAITNQGLSNEQWTLDSVLPSNTESGVLISTSPFLLAKTFTLSGLTQLRDVFFNIGSKYKGKQFLLKLLLQNMAAAGQLEISDGQFFYSNQGEYTS